MQRRTTIPTLLRTTHQTTKSTGELQEQIRRRAYDRSKAERMNNDRFTVEESTALLHAVYPNYPDLRGMKPVPEVGAFLQGLRTRDSSHSETIGREPLRFVG